MQSQQAYQDTYRREAGALPVPFLGVACDVEATHGCGADTGGEGNLCSFGRRLSSDMLL